MLLQKNGGCQVIPMQKNKATGLVLLLENRSSQAALGDLRRSHKSQERKGMIS